MCTWSVILYITLNTWEQNFQKSFPPVEYLQLVNIFAVHWSRIKHFCIVRSLWEKGWRFVNHLQAGNCLSLINPIGCEGPIPQSFKQVMNVNMMCRSWFIWNVGCLPVEHVQSAWTKSFSVVKTTPFVMSGSMNYCSASANEIVLGLYVEAYRYYLTTGSEFTCAVYC